MVNLPFYKIFILPFCTQINNELLHRLTVMAIENDVLNKDWLVRNEDNVSEWDNICLSADW